MSREPDARRAEFESEALPHLDPLYASAFYLCGDRDRAQDLVQESLLRAFRFFHQFEPGTNCRAWLLTILHNTFRNQYRAGLRERGHVDVDDPAMAREASEAGGAGAQSNPEAQVISSLLDGEIVDALQQLPEEFRSAVELVDLRELTYEEAARVLDCPIGTVRSRLSRGRRALEARLVRYARERGLKAKRDL
jgi:RNA polymerase sigma-70 factor (ECF subfamily)